MFKKNALLSVFYKDGIVEFAQGIIALGWRLYASGGTTRCLKEAGISVTDVAELVGGGAILGHRVVTLSREVHAGLLARDIPEDLAELEKLGIPWIDLVCVDLYPLQEEINNPAATPESVIEKTDIGGPTLLRAAAKGGRIVICDPTDRKLTLRLLETNDDVPPDIRRLMAAKTEGVVAQYCLASSRYHSNGSWDGLIGRRSTECKYGENAYQTPAALYSTDTEDPLALNQFKLVAGTAPSYNNYVDLDRLLQTITHAAAAFDLNTGKVPLLAIAVKHGNACGAAFGDDPITVLQKTVMGDPRAIFGGLVMTNFPLGEQEAEILLSYGVANGRRILDGIMAPSFTDNSIAMLARKKDKCRFLTNPTLAQLGQNSLDLTDRFRYVRGGFLRQPNYAYIFNFDHPQLQVFGEINADQKNNLLLAWAVNATSNSNTITLVDSGMLIGNGTGQQDRVGAAELAIKKVQDAGHVFHQAVAVSDSFFPFPDGPQRLCNASVSVIMTTAGSMRDEEVQQTIREKGVTLLMIPDTVGRGFFGH